MCARHFGNFEYASERASHFADESAGSAVSTPEEVLRFAFRALRGRKISRASLRKPGIGRKTGFPFFIVYRWMRSVANAVSGKSRHIADPKSRIPE